MSFSYNDEGLRVSKTVNGVTTNYYYQGTLLIAEETNSNIIVYLYDENGTPVGFMYRADSYAEEAWDIYAPVQEEPARGRKLKEPSSHLLER